MGNLSTTKKKHVEILSFITEFKIEFLLPFVSCRKVLGKQSEIMSEKAYCHLQISMISLQNLLVTFQFVSNLLKNLRHVMVL